MRLAAALVLALVSSAAAFVPQGTPPAKAPPPTRTPLQPSAALSTQTRDRKTGAIAPADPKAGQRSVAQQIVNVEKAHRDRAARLARLTELFTQSGQTDKVKLCEELGRQESRKYVTAMQGYRALLGEELFLQVARTLRIDLSVLPSAAPAGKPRAGGSR